MRAAALLLLFPAGGGTAGLRRIYAAGSGQGMLALPETAAEIIALSGLAAPRVLYLGAATYDDADAERTQTQAFVDAGCPVAALRVAVAAPGAGEAAAAFAAADVVLLSGGNTLYARDRFVKLGLDALMRRAMARGAVLCGGSAGGIMWFDGGHSDSMDARSYKNPPGPFLNPTMSEEQMDSWAYVRVPGLGFVPGLFCPHYDMTQSNGVPRASDFTGMLRHHSGERGLGVDNWAALVIDGDNYTVVSRQGKPGSVGPGGDFRPGQGGAPGVWRMRVDGAGRLHRDAVPHAGRAADLLAAARYVEGTGMLFVARGQNPDDGRPPTWDSAEYLRRGL